GWLARMESGVEAGDLRQIRQLMNERPDGREIVRLMMRRQRRECGQSIDGVGRHPAVGCKGGAAVNDTMSGAGEPDALTALPKPTEQEGQRGGVGRDGWQGFAGAIDRFAATVGRGEARLRADRRDLAAADQKDIGISSRDFVDTKLQARRAGVEDEETIGHLNAEPPTPPTLLRTAEEGAACRLRYGEGLVLVECAHRLLERIAAEGVAEFLSDHELQDGGLVRADRGFEGIADLAGMADRDALRA